LKKEGSIGVFDSGLGGISVLSDIHKSMPNESLIYYGDSLNAPYGIKSKSEVYELSKRVCNTLLEKNCKAVVIACNTATSAAVTKLREEFSIPIIGMEPAVKPALEKVQGKVLVLATEMTLREDKFNFLIHKIDSNDRVIKFPAPMLVTLVENHFQDPTLVEKTIGDLFRNINENIEAVVLGCTHFIFLRDVIQSYFGNHIKVIDGNFGTVTQLRRQLEKHNLCSEALDDGKIEIYNSRGDEYIQKSWEMLTYFKSGVVRDGK